MSKGHHDDGRHDFAVGNQVIHDQICPAGLASTHVQSHWPMQQVENRIRLIAAAVARWRINHHSASRSVLLVDVQVLVQHAMRYIAECHELRFFSGNFDLTFVDTRGRTDVSVQRIGHRQPVHDEPILIRAGFECVGGVSPHAFVVFLQVKGFAGEIARHLHSLGVGGLKAECNLMVGADLR